MCNHTALMHAACKKPSRDVRCTPAALAPAMSETALSPTAYTALTDSLWPVVLQQKAGSGLSAWPVGAIRLKIRLASHRELFIRAAIHLHKYVVSKSRSSSNPLLIIQCAVSTNYAQMSRAGQGRAGQGRAGQGRAGPAVQDRSVCDSTFRTTTRQQYQTNVVSDFIMHMFCSQKLHKLTAADTVSRAAAKQLRPCPKREAGNSSA